eukprot:6303988-Pyramimonas_sp.AAC.1
MAFSHPRRRAGSRLVPRGPRKVTRWPGRQNAGSQHAWQAARARWSQASCSALGRSGRRV